MAAPSNGHHAATTAAAGLHRLPGTITGVQKGIRSAPAGSRNSPAAWLTSRLLRRRREEMPEATTAKDRACGTRTAMPPPLETA